MEKLRSAAAFYSRGDLASALRDAEAAVAVDKSNPGALQFVGVLHCQLGRPDRGIDYFGRALKLAPADNTLRFNLATALLEAGRGEEAERIASEDAARSDPQLLRVRAHVLKSLGRNDEAVAAYEQLVSTNPNDFEGWNNLGNARFAAGDAGGGVLALERARDINPSSAIARINLGRFYAALQRHEDAIQSFVAATEVAPQDPRGFYELGRALHNIDRPAEALPPLGTAARLDKNNPATFTEIGAAFADLEELGQAEQAFRLALQVGPSHSEAYLNMGLLLERQNRTAELEQLLADAHRNGVESAEIDYLRAVSLRRAGQLDNAYEVARGISSGTIDESVREELIGKLADQLGDADAAFTAFVAMNQAARSTPLGELHTGGEYLLDIKALAQLTTPEWVASWPSVELPSEPPNPVFLLGFPRSGTTLLDTVLMGHEHTQVLEEQPVLARAAEPLGSVVRLPEIEADEVRELRSRYFEELAKIVPPDPAKIVIDKNPLAMVQLPLINRLFPESRVILTLRHPCDVVLSCFMQNFRPTRSMSSFTDLHQAALVYDAIMSYWDQCQGIFPMKVHTVRYEGLIEDMEGETRPLLEFLGLDWDPRVLDHQRTARERGNIRTPSYSQVTEKLYSRAEGRWLRYRRYFGSALPVLQPWIEKFGYSAESPVTTDV